MVIGIVSHELLPVQGCHFSFHPFSMWMQFSSHDENIAGKFIKNTERPSPLLYISLKTEQIYHLYEKWCQWPIYSKKLSFLSVVTGSDSSR